MEITRARAKPVAVSVAVPCPRCTHREVCAIRPTIERLDTEGTEVALPELNPALTPTLTVSIECGFFVLDKSVPKPAADGSPKESRKLNLTPEDRERRRQQALAMVAKQAADRRAAQA